MPFEDPVDLLFLAPHEVPVVGVGLLPLAVDQPGVDAVLEAGLEFDVGRVGGVVFLLDVPAEVLRHVGFLFFIISPL